MRTQVSGNTRKEGALERTQQTQEGKEGREAPGRGRAQPGIAWRLAPSGISVGRTMPSTETLRRSPGPRAFPDAEARVLKWGYCPDRLRAQC